MKEIKLTKENIKKIEWYDALTKLLNLGFDLEKNNALDLLSATNELIELDKKEKRGKHE